MTGDKGLAMAVEAKVIEVSSMPELAHLADEVKRSGVPLVLRRHGQDVALLVPANQPGHHSKRKRTRTSQIDLESIAGAAGSLPQPMTWEEIEQIVAEERAEAYRAKRA